MDVPHGAVDTLKEYCYNKVQEIDYIEEPITYQDFFTTYLQTNRPCVLGSWATDSWKSRVEWVLDNGPNLKYLADKFGNVEGPAANCGEEEFCSHKKDNQTVKEYLLYMREYKESGYNKDLPCLYLKDWHFTRLFPEYQAYITPAFFQSDWLNEFWDSREDREDDYRFVYIGPKGSWTPFHADVFRSYSWSANICGKKKWIFFPPGEEEYLKDRLGNLVYDINDDEINDPQRYPNYGKLKKRFEVLQNPGEIIFVPSGWHHQVHNMEDTISINHNWINGCNIKFCWKFIQDSLADVQKQIDDCRDMDGWHQQCQLILKASSGIDYAEFYRFIHTICCTRLEFLIRDNTSIVKTEQSQAPDNTKRLSHNTGEHKTIGMEVDGRNEKCIGDQRVFQSAKVTSQPYYLTKSHAMFDISQIRLVVADMCKDTVFQQLDYSTLPQVPVDFLKDIDQALSTIKPS